MRNTVDKTTKFLMTIGCVIFSVVVLIVIANILGRKLFNVPIKGATELIQYGAMLSVGLVMARTGYEGRHILVPIIIDKFGRIGKQLFLVIGALFGTCTFAALAYLFFSEIPAFLADASRTTEAWRIPYYLINAIMGTGFAIATLEYLFEVCEKIAFLFKRRGSAADSSLPSDTSNSDF